MFITIQQVFLIKHFAEYYRKLNYVSGMCLVLIRDLESGKEYRP